MQSDIINTKIKIKEEKNKLESKKDWLKTQFVYHYLRTKIRQQNKEEYESGEKREKN